MPRGGGARPAGTAARPAHRPSRRGEIVEAAVRVFARSGLRASMAEIAQECGLGPSAVYYHFASKNELFTAAVTAVAEHVEGATADAERAVPGVLPMHDAVAVVWRWSAEHRDAARLLYSWTLAGPAEARLARQQFVERYRAKVLERIPGRPRTERVDELVDHLVVRTYMNLAMGLSEAWVNGEPIGGTVDQDVIVETLTEVSRRLTGAR